jgi:tetratricopeptide (TPR) repeat protein
MTPFDYIRAGLNTSGVLASGAELADEAGIGSVSLAALAERLCVKAPALYKHVDGIGDLALDNLGIALWEVGRFDEAIAVHQDAAAIFRETGDRYGEGMALDNLGLALVEVRRFDEAITAYQEDLAICRETGDRHGEGGLHVWLMAP